MTVLTLDRATVAKLTKLSDADNSPYWDSDLKGFGLRLHVDANNKLLRSFVIQYRFQNRQRKINLGDAAKITVKQARDKAKELFSKITLGVDPAAEKEEARRAATALRFDQAVSQYLDMQEKTLRPASFKNCTLYLASPKYFGALHRMPMNEITRSHVSTAIDKIVSRGTNVTASRARAWLSAFYVWCLERGHADQNPVIGSATVKANRPRDRVLSDDELRTVWKACGDDDFGKIVRLLVLTGCREKEIGGLRWSEFNDDGTVTIPGERTKNKRPLTLPVTPAMRSIIESVPHRVDRDWLFGERAVGYTDWWRAMLRFRSCVKLNEHWTLHDLRRTLVTGMANLGVEPHIIEAVINHVSGHKAGVAGIYNHARYKVQIANALAVWGNHVRGVVGGNVVAFKQTA